jgi:hypothetical protein
MIEGQEITAQIKLVDSRMIRALVADELKNPVRSVT